MNYKTPGVYLNEETSFPMSLAGLATAVPAFIGMTQEIPEEIKKDSGGQVIPTPIKVNNLLEYTKLFGTAPAEKINVTIDNANEQASIIAKLGDDSNTAEHKLNQIMYYNMQMYFNNGGGPCYVVSLGTENGSKATSANYESAIMSLETKPDITLLVLTDAAYYLKGDNKGDVYAKALEHCSEMQNRFVIFDTAYDKVKDFRKKVSDHLKYGAAYTPHLSTSINVEFSKKNVCVNKVTCNTYSAKLPDGLGWINFIGLGSSPAASIYAKKITETSLIALFNDRVVASAMEACLSSLNLKKSLLDVYGILKRHTLSDKSLGDIRTELLSFFSDNEELLDALLNDSVQLLSLVIFGSGNFVLKGELTLIILDKCLFNLDKEMGEFSGFKYLFIPNEGYFVSLNKSEIDDYFFSGNNNVKKIDFSKSDYYESENIYCFKFSRLSTFKVSVKTNESGGSSTVDTENSNNVTKVTIDITSDGTLTISVENGATVKDLVKDLVKAWELTPDKKGIMLSFDNIKLWLDDIKNIGEKTISEQSGTEIKVSLIKNKTKSFSLTKIEKTNTQLYNQVTAAINSQAKVNNFPPSGAIAGLYNKVDEQRGIWQSPANMALNSVVAPSVSISATQQESLNVDATSGKSINAIRPFLGKGTLVWGARTLDGNSNDWRYVSVRRLISYIEDTIQIGLQNYVFQPNNAMTWLQVRAMIEPFLENLWQQGALAGSKMQDAFYVNVGLGTTMTSQDILDGTMKINIGLAAVRPAEFIVLNVTQLQQQ